MSKSHRVPAYRLHKASGQARVIINGQHVYLGRFGSAESREKYARLISEKFNSATPPHRASPTVNNFSELPVNELLLRYWRFAETYYQKNGQPTKELACMRDALRPVRELFGHTLAHDFGPLALKAVREHMIDKDLSRCVINLRVNRIKRVFKWAVSEELIPAFIFDGLRTVTGLRYGRTRARETEPVQPVSEEPVDAVLPFVAPQVAAMVQVQRLTGMRPCEVVLMRPCDIDTSSRVWTFEPFDNKNRWRGHQRLILLGPKAQEIISPFMNGDAESFLFSPKEADAWRRTHRAVHLKPNRKTPIFPSELRAREKAKLARRKRKPKRPKRDHYDTASYRRAVSYGLKKAQKAGVVIPHWHPSQLRHSRATEIRRRYGLEAAQIILGHTKADVTQIYAARDLRVAEKIMGEIG